MFIEEVNAELVAFRVRPESEDGSIIGDAYIEVRPGEEKLRLGFEALVALGLGAHEIDTSGEAAP
jgi:hypothetical protein